MINRVFNTKTLWETPNNAAFQCNASAINGTYLASYAFESSPIGIYEASTSDGDEYQGRFIIQDGIIKGNITDITGNDGVSGAQINFDVGAPLKKITTTAKLNTAQGKKNWEILLRMPELDPISVQMRLSNGTIWGLDWVYHSCQILRAAQTGNITTDPKEHVLNIWGIDYKGQLLAQKRLKSEIEWQAATSYTAVEVAYGDMGELTGNCVIPSGGGTRKFECIVAGTSGDSEPAAFSTAAFGDIISEGPDTLQWQCTPNVDYQSVAADVEILDTGTMIKFTVGTPPNSVTAYAFNSTNYGNKYFALKATHSSGEAEYGPITGWT